MDQRWLAPGLWHHLALQTSLHCYTSTGMTPWSAMDERAKRHHRAKVCTCARADATHPDLCKALIYWAPSHTQNLNAILPAVCEIWKRGKHVRTCRCTPFQTCGKHLSNGSLVTHQIWTQSAQLFARSGKRVCTCARADALHLKHVEIWTQSGQPLWSYQGRGCPRQSTPSPRHVSRAVAGTGGYRCRSNIWLIGWWRLIKVTVRELVIPFQRNKRSKSVTTAGRSYWVFSRI